RDFDLHGWRLLRAQVHDALLEGLVAIQPSRGNASRLGDRLEIDRALLFQKVSDGRFGPASGVHGFLLRVRSQAVDIAFPRSRHCFLPSPPDASRAAMSGRR